MGDEEILKQALEQAVPAYAAKKVGTSLLGQPSPDNTILDPVCAAIEKCNAYRAVAGHMLFSAGAGVVIHAPRLATDLVYRAERGISDAVEWLLRLLSTREANGILKAAIWALSIDEEIPLSDLSKLMPFESLPDSHLKDIICHRSRQMYDNSMLIRLTPKLTIGSRGGNEMPSCPPSSCPTQICHFRVLSPSSNASFVTTRIAPLTLKRSAGAMGSSADGAANPVNPTASPTGRTFSGVANVSGITR